MCGWRRLASSSASRWKLSSSCWVSSDVRVSGGPSERLLWGAGCSRITLSAIGRWLSSKSIARYTLPMPPESSSSTTSKRPATTVPGSRSAPSVAGSVDRSSCTSRRLLARPEHPSAAPSGVIQRECTNAYVEVRWSPRPSFGVSRFGVVRFPGLAGRSETPIASRAVELYGVPVRQDEPREPRGPRARDARVEAQRTKSSGMSMSLAGSSTGCTGIEGYQAPTESGASSPSMSQIVLT